MVLTLLVRVSSRVIFWVQDALVTCVAYHKKYLLDLQTIPLLQNFSHLKSIKWIALKEFCNPKEFLEG